MRRRQWLFIALTSVVCVLTLTFVLITPAVSVDSDTDAVSRPCIVIDAGHGGFDGGASAVDGTAEKDLNLAIARPLAAMLTVCGFEVVMTRTQDEGLQSDDSSTVREKKVSDMHARLALYEQAQLTVSIHQNMFASSSCRGAQVFYSVNHPYSKALASCVREQLIVQVQPDNTRELKTGNRDIYLLYKTTKPAVLVECGFLSNPGELERLKSTEYQKQLAWAIACGVLRYTEEKEGAVG